VDIKRETLTAEGARAVVRESGLEGYGYRERIEQYKRWMRAGKWSLFYNGTSSGFIQDPLIFLPEGILYEGKHRVIALSEMEDGFRAEFWVLRDFTEQEAFRRWYADFAAGRLPVADWHSQELPAHPRAASGA
jgi:hypothetical protein